MAYVGRELSGFFFAAMHNACEQGITTLEGLEQTGSTDLLASIALLGKMIAAGALGQIVSLQTGEKPLIGRRCG